MGFQPLEHRFLIKGDPTAWLSEAGRNHQWIEDSIGQLQEILNGSPALGP